MVVQGKTLNCGGNLDLRRWVNEQQKTLIIIVACPDQGACNDHEPLRLVFHQGPAFITAYFDIVQN